MSLLCLFYFATSNAQVHFLPDTHRCRIDFIHEFIDLYNEIANDSLQENESRNPGLRLFDLSKFYSKEDPEFINASYFSKEIKNSKTLSLSDNQTVCTVRCICNYQGENKEIQLFLKQVQTEGNIEWIVSSIESDWLDVYNDKESAIGLLPDEHEENFIGLSKINNGNVTSMRRVFHNNHGYDKSSVLAFLIKAGLLRIKHTKDIEFIFLQIPDYVFHVTYFNRNTDNSGWLISNFYKMSEYDKSEFIKNINQDISVPLKLGRVKY